MLFFQLVIQFVLAQELIEKNIEVKTNSSNPVQARTALMDQAVEKVSEEMIVAIIGEAKYQRNRAQIQSRVLKKSGRYIPFTKASDLVPVPGAAGFSMSVQLKVSPKNLEALLLENGLFYESDGTPLIVSFIQWVDRVQLRSFSWWSPGQNDKQSLLAKLSQETENSLKGALQKQNFYLIPTQAQRYGEALSRSEQVENLRLEDQQALAQKYSAQIFIQGRFSWGQLPNSRLWALTSHVQAMQAGNGRSIGEVFRQVELGVQVSDSALEKKAKELMEQVALEIAAQIVDAWQKGSLGSEVYRLRLVGRFNVIEREQAKLALESASKDLKSIRERKITPDELIFEFESATKPDKLKLSDLQVAGKRLRFEGVDGNELVYRLRR